MKQADSYLSLGSNIGDRLGHLRMGIDSISELDGAALNLISAIYETDPVGVIDQPPFLNLALGITTSLDPHELLKALKGIESTLGRSHRQRWREREIDIDIILYSDRVFRSPDLTIPHESAHMRRFVLQPLSDIAPNVVHPVLKKTVRQLLTECPDNSGVRLVQASPSQAN